MMISLDSKEWQKISNPIFNKADKFCQKCGGSDDVWSWYVAEEVAKKICDKKLSIDKNCVSQIYEWKNLGVAEYNDDVWSAFKDYIKKENDNE